MLAYQRIFLDKKAGLRHMTYLTLSNITAMTSAIFSERDNRGGSPLTFSVLNDLGAARFHDGAARVRSSEIDSHNTVAKNERDELEKFNEGERQIMSFCSSR